MSEARARGAVLREMQRSHGRPGRLAMMDKLYGGPMSSDSTLNALAKQLRGQVSLATSNPVSRDQYLFELAGMSCLSSALF